MSASTRVDPVDSFKEAAPLLRRPFTSHAVKFKVQATWPKDHPTGGLIVAYIDARLTVERLNMVVPHLWYDEYEPLGTKHLICRLTVDGISRQDVGEGTGKGLYSDALKRAAVKFGVGVSLYAIPKMMLDVSDGHLKPRRDSLELTPAGEKRVRSTYETWLKEHGIKAFGDPLDHGDSEDAQGDAEVDGQPPVEREPRSDEPEPPVATDTQLKQINDLAEECGVGPSVLANIMKLAAGSEVKLFVTEDEAAQWLHRAMPRLPRRLVSKVMEGVEAERVPVPS